MPATFKREVDLAQLRPHPLGHGVTPQKEPAVSGGRADVHQPQKREGLGLSETTPASIVGGEPSELDQPGLVLRQLQTELRKSLPKLVLEAAGVTLVLESDDHIVREADDDHVACGVAVTPRLGPQVYDIMQVHVCEQR